ncbi:MAG: hypothetical protein AAF747_09570 [Planctomycetota bacterium]
MAADAKSAAAAGGGGAKNDGGGAVGPLLVLAVLGVVTAGLTIGVLSLVLSEPEPQAYELDTPDAVLQAAKSMVAANQAERLHELIAAPDDGSRMVLMEIGRLFGHIQDLGNAAALAYPDEIRQLRERALASAENGEASSALSAFVTGRSFDARGMDMRERFDDAITQLMTDPYSWLESAEERLDFQYIVDGQVAVTWDGRGVLQPLGLIVEEQADGQWRVLLPTESPSIARFRWVANYLPQTEEEFKIWASLVRVFDNLVVDLIAGVESGKYRTLATMTEAAIEGSVVPAAMVFYAYNQAVEARQRGGD